MDPHQITQEQLDAIHSLYPECKPTGLYVGKKEKKFLITIQVYKQSEKVFYVSTYAEALDIQQGASAMAELIGWTRHSSCEECVYHLDSAFDLYNEGFITIKRD
jgi:hypothetical protein